MGGYSNVTQGLWEISRARLIMKAGVEAMSDLQRHTHGGEIEEDLVFRGLCGDGPKAWRGGQATPLRAGAFLTILCCQKKRVTN